MDTSSTPDARRRHLEGYEDWLYEFGLTANTIEQRLGFVDRQLREWGTFDVTPRQIVEWLAEHDGWTRRTYYSHALSVFEFLLESGAIEKNPMARLRRPPEPSPRPKPLTEEQLGLALSNATGDLRTWLLLAYLAGFRAMEIAKIRGEQVSHAALEVTGKGGKTAAVPTHSLIWEAAADYPRIGWWFPNDLSPSGHITGNAISQRVRRYLRSIGIEERGAIHRLRHSYCTRLSRNGTSTRVIQELMRHASLATTQLYIEVDSDEKRRAIEAIRA